MPADKKKPAKKKPAKKPAKRYKGSMGNGIGGSKPSKKSTY